MRPIVVALVLLAAVLHATWNAVLRSGTDRFWTVTVMSFATSGVALCFAFALPLPLADAWPYLAGSASLQVGYILFLTFAYRHGELSQVYPIVRGSVPLMVTLGSYVLLNQKLTPPLLAGVGLISAGIVSLAFGRGRAAPTSVALGLTTGLFIAAYVTVDGVGVRLSGDARAYTAWIFLIYGAAMPLMFRLLRGHSVGGVWSVEGRKAMMGGIVSLVSYGAVTSALALGPLGPISALRETSIVFSLLIGRLALREALSRRRVLVCAAVTLGAVCIGYTAR